MEMLGPLLGLAGAAAQSGWQGLGMAIQLQNMRNQQRNADRQYRFAGAGRTDAYGNKQSYDDLSNEWKILLSPTQERITKAGEREQLLSLTEDAERNRSIKKRAAERGKQAGKDYNEVLQGFRYDKPASEASIRGDLTELLAGQVETSSRKGNAEAIRQAIRQGGPSQITSLTKATNDDIGAELPKLLLQAKQGAMQEKQGREQAFSSKYMPVMQQLAQMMDQGGDMPVRMSTTPDELRAQQGQQANLILQALQGGSQLESGAAQAAGKQAGASGPDLRALASMMGGVGKGMKGMGMGMGQSENIDNSQWYDSSSDWLNNTERLYGSDSNWF